MADLALILAGPAVGLALVAGYLLGRRSNVQRQVDARLRREMALPPVCVGHGHGSAFERDLGAFKITELYRGSILDRGLTMDSGFPIVGVDEPPSRPAASPSTPADDRARGDAS